MLSSLNNETIANSGAAMVVTSLGVIATAISIHSPTPAFIEPFVGVIVGMAACYFGRPSTLSVHTETAPTTVAADLHAVPKETLLTTPATSPVTKATIVGEFADAFLAEFDTIGKPVVEGLISTGEADAVALLANFLKTLPKPAGFAGALLAPVETAFENAANAYAATAIAKYGPDAVFAIVDVQLHKWAVDLGG